LSIQKIHISRLELQRGPLNVLSPFIFGMRDLVLADFFWDHVIEIYVIKISMRQMRFQFIFSHLWKVKILFGKHSLPIIKYFFWGTVMYVQYGSLYLIPTRHKLTVCLPSLVSLFSTECWTFGIRLNFPRFRTKKLERNEKN
jgi:hypothetical protein